MLDFCGKHNITADVEVIPSRSSMKHAATPMTEMTHTAIQEMKNGKVVDSMEHVSEDQYRG
jgi:hypothetical protein